MVAKSRCDGDLLGLDHGGSEGAKSSKKRRESVMSVEGHASGNRAYAAVISSLSMVMDVTKWRCRDPIEFSSVPIFYTIRNNRPS